MEEELRLQAVALIKQGHRPAEVAKMLHRSRQWVYKWIDRSQSEGEQWSQSKPHARHNVTNRTDPLIEEAVLKTRLMLEETHYSGVGAYPILYALKQQGIKPPSTATINRILKKHGIFQSKQKYVKSGIDYPESPFNLHLMDLIGPRYLKGAKRYFMLTIISNDTRMAGVYPILSKSGEDITRSVTSFWQYFDTPDYLQMDNELSFKGSNRHPRGLGQLLRTSLSLNVAPIFIPVGEPWRNGVIERFNQTVQERLLSQTHRDFEELIARASEFMRIHNAEHHYSTLSHKTPELLCKEQNFPLHPLSADYQYEDRPALDCWNKNEIHFIRLVRSDCVINVLNTDVRVDKSLAHTYVDAILCLNEHVLAIFQDGQLKQIEPFAMPVI